MLQFREFNEDNLILFSKAGWKWRTDQLENIILYHREDGKNLIDSIEPKNVENVNQFCWYVTRPDKYSPSIYKTVENIRDKDVELNQQDLQR